MKPLFYNHIAALSHKKHHNVSVQCHANYSFAKSTNSVPLGVGEFHLATHYYPIVFLANEDGLSPIAIIGLETKQNIWVDDSGKWLNDYVPAYIRRYPFIAVKTAQDAFTLCVDESADVVNRDGRGTLLFNGHEPSEYLNERYKLVEAYELEQKRNQILSSILLKHKLLEAAQLNFKAETETDLLSGFLVVSRKRLDELESEAVAELHKSGAMELIYQHLFSLERFQMLAAHVGTYQNSLVVGE